MFHGIDARQLLSEEYFTEDFVHPIGEIIRRPGHEIVMLEEEVMGVVVNRRIWDSAKEFQERWERRGSQSR